MSAVIILIVVGTSIWVGFDARTRDWSSYDFANRPWKWFVGCLLFWIVVFPLYLARRGRQGHARPTVLPVGRPAFAGASVSARSAGWYPDPFDDLRLRYWDGGDWTEQVAERRDASGTFTEAS